MILWIFLAPCLILLSFSIFLFGDMPISSEPPDWSDGLNFLGLFFVSLSLYFIYIQAETQNIRDELNRINALLDEISSLIETIQYSSKTGTDAIILFAKEYVVGGTPHPRVVIDKIQYSICLIRVCLSDLTKINDRTETLRIAQKACLLFYTHLYFTITSLDKEGKCLLVKLEPQYNQFKDQFTDLQKISYYLLRKWNLVGPHHESENFLSLRGEEFGELKDVYRYFN